MSPHSRDKFIEAGAASCCDAAALVAAGCSSGSMITTGDPSAIPGPTFVVGTDAPMASVVSFQVTVDSVA